MSLPGETSFPRILLVTGLILAMLFVATSAGPVPSSLATPPLQKAREAENYGKIPLTFEANQGQADRSVKFLARGSSYGVYLTGHEAALMLCKPVYGTSRGDFHRNVSPIRKSALCDVVHMQLAGATSTVEPIGEEQLQGKVNYFVGSDPAKWHAGIPAYAKVRYPGIYPGIDLIYFGDPSADGQLEFDFVVAADAEPGRIRLWFAGPSELHLATNGDLVVGAANQTLAVHKPVVYQMVDGQRRAVAGDFALLGKHTVGFRLGSYDHARQLVIDPQLAYSTFLGGGNGDAGNAIAVDNAGNVYVTGSTASTDFPITQGAFQTTGNVIGSEWSNAFVTKLNPTGTALIYSTFLGGTRIYGTGNNGTGDTAYGLAIDSAGNAYVTGAAFSTDFPITQGAFQITNKAATNGGTAFVTMLNPTGTALVYSTYLGGSGSQVVYPGDRGNAIALDARGDAYVTGMTSSGDFPVTPGAFQMTNHGVANGFLNAFVTEINPTGTALVYSTYLGGSGGARLGYLGDTGNAIALDASSNAYLTGEAASPDFPVTAGAYQSANHAVADQGPNAFVTKLNPAGTALVYSTYLGGSGGVAPDIANAIAVDSAGNAYVAGQTGSTDFPVTPGAFQSVNHFGFTSFAGPASGGPNAFITKLNAAGSSLIYSTYLGGSGGVVNMSPTLFLDGGDQVNGLAVDGSGNVYVTGFTASGNFPVTQGAYQTVNNDFAGVEGQAPCAGGCIGGYNAFVTELNPTGSALVYSTYLGGNGINTNQCVGVAMFGDGDQANALALDSSSNVYVTGVADSSDFPVTAGAFQTTNPATCQGVSSSFVAKLKMGPGFTITGTAVTVTPGATTGNTSTITVTPSGGFTGSVALTAAVTSSPSGAQDPPTFSFGSTSPVDITGSTAGTATLTITTWATGGCAQASRTPLGVPWYTGGAALACVLLFGIPARRRGWRAALGMLLLTIVVGGLLACGGGGRSTCNGTTPGTYTITVTGTSGATTATGTVTLTVQ